MDDARDVSTPITIQTAALTVIVVTALVFVLRLAQPLVVSILFAILLAYALDPLLRLLLRANLPRPIAAAVALAALVAGAGVVWQQAGGYVNAFAADLPAAVADLRQAVAQAHNRQNLLDAIHAAGVELQGAMRSAAPLQPTPRVRRIVTVPRAIDVSAVVRSSGVAALAASGYAIAVGTLTLIILAGGDVYRRKLIKAAGRLFESRKITIEVLAAIDRQIERYLVVRVAISAIVAAATALGLWALGLDHWLGWGIVAGALNVLPFIGPTLAVGLIACAALAQFGTLGMVAGATAVAGAVAIVEGNVLTPWLTSRAGELNTPAVFVGVLFWGWLWGFWGLLLALPILVAIKAASDHIEPLQPLGELLGR